MPKVIYKDNLVRVVQYLNSFELFFKSNSIILDLNGNLMWGNPNRDEPPSIVNKLPKSVLNKIFQSSPEFFNAVMLTEKDKETF